MSLPWAWGKKRFAIHRRSPSSVSLHGGGLGQLGGLEGIRMRVLGSLRVVAWGLAMTLMPMSVLAGGGEKQGKLVHVADTRNLTGFNLYFANLYNTNRVLFTLEVMLITVGMGIVLGILMDKIVAMIGLDLTKRSVKE